MQVTAVLDVEVLDAAAPGSHSFERIATDIESKGYSINPGLLPVALTDDLLGLLDRPGGVEFHRAGIGRDARHMLNEFVRTDEICWITGSTAAGRSWLDWAGQLQRYLNRRLFLGLFSFESHLAHYAAGDYYKRHLDSFKGEANRVLSLVVYLNPGWIPEDGGELVLYRDEQDLDGLKVLPVLGTVVVFLSEEFPHEVLPARRDRFSVAGWFRVNGTTAERVDPPT